MENRRFKCTCSKEKKTKYINNEFYIIYGCGQRVELSLDDVIAGKELDAWGDESLAFYYKCPNCGMVHNFDCYLEIEERKYLMEKYALIADEMLELWQIEKIIKEAEKLNKRKNEIENKIFEVTSSNRDTSRLYGHWERTDEKLKRIHRLK